MSSITAEAQETKILAHNIIMLLIFLFILPMVIELIRDKNTGSHYFIIMLLNFCMHFINSDWVD